MNSRRPLSYRVTLYGMTLLGASLVADTIIYSVTDYVGNDDISVEEVMRHSAQTSVTPLPSSLERTITPLNIGILGAVLAFGGAYRYSHQNTE